MYGIFTYIYPKNDPNVGKYSIHGASGIQFHQSPVCESKITLQLTEFHSKESIGWECIMELPWLSIVGGAFLGNGFHWVNWCKPYLGAIHPRGCWCHGLIGIVIHPLCLEWMTPHFYQLAWPWHMWLWNPIIQTLWFPWAFCPYVSIYLQRPTISHWKFGRWSWS